LPSSLLAGSPSCSESVFITVWNAKAFATSHGGSSPVTVQLGLKSGGSMCW
jgi:hypothetical protein